MIRLFAFVLSFTAGTLFAQTGAVTGLVVDQTTGKPLRGANVLIQDANTGAMTNEAGAFRFMRLQPGEHILRVSYVGYRTVSQRVLATSDPELLRIELTTSPLPLMEMTVSVPRYATTPRESALPLAVVTSERLAAAAPVTVSDALQNEPGIALQRDGVWATSVSIRGLGRSSIVTLIDGQRIDTATDIAAALSMFAVQDIERIEVIKSAASSIYGSGAIGGVVNIVSKDGWYQEAPYLRLRLQSGYSSVNHGCQGYATVNVGGGRWYGRISGGMRSAGVAQTPEGPLPNSQFRDNNLAARLSFKPLRRHEIKLDYQRFYAHDVGLPGGYPLFPDAATVRYPFEKRELFSGEYLVSHLSRWMPQLSFKIYHQKIWRDVENLPHTVNRLPAANGQPARNVHVLRILPGATHEIPGMQLQANILAGRSHLLIGGIDGWQKEYQGYRTKETRIDILNPDGSVKKSSYRTIGEAPLPDATYSSIGLFLQDEWRPWQDRLVLTLGGRTDRIATKNEATLNPLYEIVDGLRNDQPAGQKVLWPASTDRSTSWSANFSLLYRPRAHMDVTLNLARSFRAPSLEERYQYIDLGSLVRVGDAQLAPEAGRSGDLGLRIWSDFLQLQINGFYNRLRDLVVEMPGSFEGRKALLKTNIGKAELYGGDLRLDVKPMPNCALWARASWVHGADLFSGQPLPQIAPLNGSIGYRNGCLRWLTFDISALLFATQERIASGELRTPGYATCNLYLSSREFHLRGVNTLITLGVENITNRAYRNHLATNRGLVGIEPGRNLLLNWHLEM